VYKNKLLRPKKRGSLPMYFLITCRQKLFMPSFRPFIEINIPYHRNHQHKKVRRTFKLLFCAFLSLKTEVIYISKKNLAKKLIFNDTVSATDQKSRIRIHGSGVVEEIPLFEPLVTK